MHADENPIFGRKVFFLNLSQILKDIIINPLRELEYEVFTISDYKSAKNILRKYPDSILFVNIDIHENNKLSTNQWFNFLHSLQNDPELKNIFSGVITKRMTTSEQNFFMLNLQIPAGLISIRNGNDDLLESLINVLDLNGAKGRRQYVRSRCQDTTNAYIKCLVGTTPMNLKINDISSVGISCYLPNEQTSLFQPNYLIRDIDILLNRDNSKCDAVVLTTKPFKDDLSLIVLLLVKGTPRSVKNSIRGFVFNQIQREINKSISGMPNDEYEYKEEISLDDNSGDDGFLLEVDDAEEAEPLE